MTIEQAFIFRKYFLKYHSSEIECSLFSELYNSYFQNEENFNENSWFEMIQEMVNNNELEKCSVYPIYKLTKQGEGEYTYFTGKEVPEN